jgi:hypothetical protein
MKAAGRCLTVGELREAIAGLDKLTPVAAHDYELSEVVAGTTLVEIDPDVPLDIDERWNELAALRKFVLDVATGGAGNAQLRDVRSRAGNLVDEYGLGR